MSDNTTSTSGGIGFVGLLTIVFITLKLLDKIDWSWWWVLSPIWITAGVIISFLGIGGLVLLIVWVVTAVITRSK
jgi:hypothetical protein